MNTSSVPGNSNEGIGGANRIEAADDYYALNKLYREQRWGDGLPVFPPTLERVNEMLSSVRRSPQDVVATLAPGFGAATVELIAINAVLAGCDPAYLPVIIAAVEAVGAPEFNLQAVQSTTNSATALLIVSGPLAGRLQMNSGLNCLGQGTWANATIGRALHLCMQNIGKALPGEMDRATQGQPGKYAFCCAENSERNPWTPLQVDYGHSADDTVVTVVPASGSLNMNVHDKDPDELLRVLADSMGYPASNDYWCGGAPWVILGPEHAAILAGGGLSKVNVQRELWERSKIEARRMSRKEFDRVQNARRDELGTVAPDTLLPISPTPAEIGIIVAGGPGTHSVYIPTFGNARSVTRQVSAG